MRASPLPAILLLLTAVTLWGGNFVIGRAVRAEVPPIALSALRWALAGALLLPFVWRDLWTRRGLVRAHWPLLLGLSVTGLVVFNAVAYLALRWTGSINAALANSTIPGFVLLFAWLMDGERPRGVQLAGLAVSAAGVAVMLARGDPVALAAQGFNPGDALILTAMASWGIYTVLLRRLPPGGFPGLALLAVLIGIAVPILAVGAAIEQAVDTVKLQASATTLWAVLYTALAASLAAYLAWNTAVGMIGPQAAAPFLHLIPLANAAIAIPALGESLRPYHAVGFVLIVTGIVVATRPRG